MRNGIEALPGEEGTVVKEIPGSIHLGEVRARGDLWAALSATGEPIPAGTVVFILDVDQGHLLVAPSPIRGG
jgi:membrane protein implicated in regulation of membrane protease activity